MDPNTDFIKVSTLVRSYQYIEEVPAYFTEAIVDFLIPKKGNKLTYQLHSVRAYRNDNLIEESGTESGALRMAQNGLTNFLLNTPFPLSHNYEVRSTETPSSYDIYLNGVKKGEIKSTATGEYAVNMDMLTDKESRPRSLFGRTNTLKRKQIRQTISDYSQGDAISPSDFITYRLVTDLSTKYKDTDEVSLLNISEIYVLSKEGLSKQQAKSLKTGDDFGTFKQSLRPEVAEWEALPTYIPDVVEVIQKSLNQELKLMQ